VDVQRIRLLIPVICIALVAAGCGSDEDSAGDSTTAGAATTTAPVETTAPATTAAPPTTSAAGSTTGTEAGDQPVVGGGTGPSSQLEIRIWPEGRSAGEPIVYTLTCMPDGGTHPDPTAACQAVVLPMAFDPPRTDVSCTEEYGGPAVAEVTGRVQDIAIDARFTRTNGCEISRWERVDALLPLPA
jgi:hypothetical protein